MNQYKQLQANLTKLNLTNMVDNLEQYISKVNNHKLSFSEALLKLTTRQLEYEQDLALKKRINRARFPVVKSLDEFDYNFQPTINTQEIQEFSTMSFLNNQENIIFIGSPGVGKTHLAIGLGISACQQRIRTLFINCHELLLRLNKARSKGSLERVMRRYERYELLIIDELGYLPIKKKMPIYYSS